jgi:CBS domain-containing protein
MANAQQILAAKGTDVVSIGPEATVLEAAQLMNERHIGSLIVLKDNKLVGIFTERDVMRRIVSEQQDPSKTAVGDVMTSPVACAAPGTTTAEISATMREKRIRHLPVVDGTTVIGMVSIGDINRTENSAAERTIQYLEQYISVS